MHANVTYRLLNTSSFHPFGFKSLARKLCYFPGLVSTGLWLYNISVARISGLLEHQQNFIAFSNSPRKRRHKLHLGKHDLFHFFLPLIVFCKLLISYREYFRYLFQHSGYQYVMVVQIGILCFAFLLVIVFYKRLVPLQMKPAPGKSAKYKNGVFYTM